MGGGVLREIILPVFEWLSTPLIVEVYLILKQIA